MLFADLSDVLHWLLSVISCKAGDKECCAFRRILFKVFQINYSSISSYFNGFKAENFWISIERDPTALIRDKDIWFCIDLFSDVNRCEDCSVPAIHEFYI